MRQRSIRAVFASIRAMTLSRMLVVLKDPSTSGNTPRGWSVRVSSYATDDNVSYFDHSELPQLSDNVQERHTQGQLIPAFAHRNMFGGPGLAIVPVPVAKSTRKFIHE